MRKLVFIEPKSPNLHIFSQFPLPRLGVFILGTIAKQRGWDVEIVIEQTRKIDFEKLRGADLVGVSTITPTAPRAYAIADRLRKLGIPVIMGGPHVTFLPNEALEHADFVIRGEGEEALVRFLEAWKAGGDFQSVPNLSYKTGQRIVHNPTKPMTKSLDDNPYPDFSLARSSMLSISPRNSALT